MRRLRSFMLIFTCLFISIIAAPATTQASNQFDLSKTDFAKLPVLHEGRLKPLSAYSKLLLKRFAGAENYNHQSALNWLATVIFDPKTAVNIPVFKIKDTELKDMLGLDAGKNYYSIFDLSTPISEKFDRYIQISQTPIEELNPTQLDFLKLYDDIAIYNQLMRALTSILSLEVSMPKKFNDMRNPTYLDLQKYASEIAISKDPVSKELTAQLSLIQQGGIDNSYMRIIPPQWQKQENATWHTPWETILHGFGSPESREYLDIWKQLAFSFRHNNRHTFELESKKALDFISIHTKKKNNLVIENYYTQIDPFFWAQTGYGIALFFIILWFTTKKRLFWRPAILSTIAALIMHKAGILMRILILERPPISTLHETILFISLIATLYTFFLEFKRKDGTSLLFASFIGLGLLILSSGFIDSGNSKPLIAAVLNSNFWLGTHVVVISLGYGFCLITSIYAHYLITQKTADKEYVRMLLPLSLFSLFLMCAGTLLGGIWADQSWGRFWGWDPKENGALLIILWLMWLIHGKLSGDVSQRFFQAGLAALNIFLALSWFGVNLLGVGLHAYGFIEGVSYGLLSFCLAELAFIIFFMLKNNKIRS